MRELVIDLVVRDLPNRLIRWNCHIVTYVIAEVLSRSRSNVYIFETSKAYNLIWKVALSIHLKFAWTVVLLFVGLCKECRFKWHHVGRRSTSRSFSSVSVIKHLVLMQFCVYHLEMKLILLFSTPSCSIHYVMWLYRRTKAWLLFTCCILWP